MKSLIELLLAIAIIAILAALALGPIAKLVPKARAKLSNISAWHDYRISLHTGEDANTKWQISAQDAFESGTSPWLNPSR